MEGKLVFTWGAYAYRMAYKIEIILRISMNEVRGSRSCVVYPLKAKNPPGWRIFCVPDQAIAQANVTLTAFSPFRPFSTS